MVFSPTAGQSCAIRPIIAQRKLLPNPPEIAMTAPAFDLEIASHRPPDSAVLQAADLVAAAAVLSSPVPNPQSTEEMSVAA